MTDNICQEPGCGTKMEFHWRGMGHDFWACPRNDDAHELCKLAAELKAALGDLVKIHETWNASVEKIIGRPPNWGDGYLDKARELLKRGTP